MTKLYCQQSSWDWSQSCIVGCRAEGGSEAASLRVAEQYMAAFGNIAKQGNTMLIPASTNDPASFVAQALSVYKSVSQGGIGTSRYFWSIASSNLLYM